MIETGRCYVIAEIGVNHNGDISIARDLIDAAAEAGADAVKFQTFSADDLVTQTAQKADYQSRNTGDAGSQYEMLKRLELGEDDFVELYAHCQAKRIDFLSTPFGPEQADLLDRVGVDAFKVSSGDLTYGQFLRHLASKGKPIILSTGMASLAEVEHALTEIDSVAPVPISILHCVSDYPADPSTCNLRAMSTMAQSFGRPVGWSDHTVGNATACAAVALGAQLLEKHITLDTGMEGPDHAASIPPDEFAQYVQSVRDVSNALGSGVKEPHAVERPTAAVARRSIVAVRDLAEGETLREEDVRILRPGTGLPPSLLPLVIGCMVRRSVAAFEPLQSEHLHV